MGKVTEVNADNINEEIANEEAADQLGLVLTNDLSEDDKTIIREFVNTKIEKVMEAPTLSINSMCHLAMVSHGSIKSRSKRSSSAREIVLGVINGVRATGTISDDRVISYYSTLSDEAKEALLAQLQTAMKK